MGNEKSKIYSFIDFIKFFVGSEKKRRFIMQAFYYADWGMLNCFYQFCATRRAYGAPGGAKLRNQTWNSGFQNDAINDVDLVRDAKHHYLKFLLIRFSCKALVERIFFAFSWFPTLQKFQFLRHPARRVAQRKSLQILRHLGRLWRARWRKIWTLSTWKKIIFCWKSFFLSYFFMNVNYG